MDVNTLKAVYFIGAGGIGMSALVRYFLSRGKAVGGYDRTPSELTEKLRRQCVAHPVPLLGRANHTGRVHARYPVRPFGISLFPRAWV